MHFYINGRFMQQQITGVQRVALEFVKTLDEVLANGEIDGVKATILLPRNGDIVSKPNLRKIEIKRVGRLSGHCWEQIELSIYAGEKPLLCLGNLAPVMRLRTKKGPTITMVHDLSYRYYPNAYNRRFKLLYNFVIPRVLKYSNHVVTVSQSEKSAILHHYPASANSSRLTFVQNGGAEMGASSSDSVTPFAGRDPICLYVGSLTKRKNAKGLFEAGIRLAREEGVKIVIIGSKGSFFEGVDAPIPDDIKGSFIFLGQINDDAIIYQYYNRARILLFPSFYEASPLPPVEAMACGLPVVASAIPSLRERCGEAAEYCDPNDASSIVGAVKRVLDSPARWNEMQQMGLLKAATYSWRAQVDHILYLLKEAQ